MITFVLIKILLMKKHKTINYWQFVLLAHLSALLAFAIVRGVQIAYSSVSLKDNTPFLEYLKCFGRGVVYDNHCSLLALVPVTLVLGIQSIIGKENKIVSKVGFWITAVFYFVEFAICCANIVYVKYQLANINFEAVKALGQGTEVLGMMTSGTYIVAFILSTVFCVGFVYLLWLLFKKFVKDGEQTRLFSIIIFIVLALLMAIGIRGRSKPKEKHIKKFQKFIGNPLNTSFAEYSDQMLLNLSAMNDFFFVEKSQAQTKKGKFKYMSNNKAEKIALRYQNYPHEADANSIKQKNHVILVLMEGMSAKVMKTFGYPKVITPFLDSIYAKSLSYCNFYSAGVITQKGMCATFSSAPTFAHFHSMEKAPRKRTVISTAYRHEGYTTQFFVPHAPTFDNVFGFFTANPFEYQYCLDDYPAKYQSLSWGAPDDYLFKFAFRKTDSLIASGVDKTLSVVYGCSNHPPYNIPDEYHKKGFSDEEAAVYYADAQLKMFYNLVRNTEWGKNALFVFVADHGRHYVSNMLASNHIPLIINHPEIQPRVDSTLGVQYDVLPTMLALTGVDYKDYRGYGIDLARSKRDTVFFGYGEKYALKTKDKLYFYSPESKYSEIWIETPEGFKNVGSKDAAFERYMKANLQYGCKFATSY